MTLTNFLFLCCFIFVFNTCVCVVSISLFFVLCVLVIVDDNDDGVWGCLVFWYQILSYYCNQRTLLWHKHVMFQGSSSGASWVSVSWSCEVARHVRCWSPPCAGKVCCTSTVDDNALCVIAVTKCKPSRISILQLQFFSTKRWRILCSIGKVLISIS